MTKIGYQGVKGAYSEMAAESFARRLRQNFPQKKVSKSSVELVGLEDFDTIFKKVSLGELDFGAIPVENSLAGSVHRNFDLLGQFHLHVVGEVHVHVNHQLLAVKGAKKSDIKEIYSHWQALAQCEHNIKKFYPNAKVVEYFDTAGAAEYIQKENDPTKASVSSKIAAKHYKLNILESDFQDDKNNFTRFLIIQKESHSKPILKHTGMKTSIIFYGSDEAGFLFKSLACFALRNINLTKIESRPVPKKPWHYYFYLDFEGSIVDGNICKALENLKEVAKEVRVLGSYEKDKI